MTSSRSAAERHCDLMRQGFMKRIEPRRTMKKQKKSAYCVVDAHTIEIRQVVAAAYKTLLYPMQLAREGCLTHAVEVDPNGSDTRVLCGRVKLDSMCNTPDRTAKVPTCSLCARKLQKDRATYVGWSVACCVEGEAGFHPVPEYGPYPGPEGEKRAQGIVDRLNERLGYGPSNSVGHKRTVRRIVGSTMLMSRVAS